MSLPEEACCTLPGMDLGAPSGGGGGGGGLHTHNFSTTTKKACAIFPLLQKKACSSVQYLACIIV